MLYGLAGRMLQATLSVGGSGEEFLSSSDIMEKLDGTTTEVVVTRSIGPPMLALIIGGVLILGLLLAYMIFQNKRKQARTLARREKVRTRIEENQVKAGGAPTAAKEKPQNAEPVQEPVARVKHLTPGLTETTIQISKSRAQLPPELLSLEAVPILPPSFGEAPSPYTVGSAMHIGTRKNQQDALYASDPVKSPLGKEGNALLGVLCDGMGGMENGEMASKLAVDTVATEFYAGFDPADIPAFLEHVANKADLAVHDTLSSGEDSSAGTTLVAVLLVENQLHWLSVGDSRIYILRGEEIVQVTRDHNFRLLLMEKVAAGEMTVEEVERNPDREALVSYLGMGGLSLVDINLQPFQLQRGDLILLCSDGLTKSLTDSQIQHFALDLPGDLEICARTLTHKAFELRKGAHQDNTSVIIIRYNQ